MNWGIISVNNINNFGENQEIMQGTQIHSKWSFWYFCVNKTSKQYWILACRTILEKYISITAKTPVVWYTRKNFKALKLVFHVIPAYKTSWTEKWHFAPLCSGGNKLNKPNFPYKIPQGARAWPNVKLVSCLCTSDS